MQKEANKLKEGHDKKEIIDIIEAVAELRNQQRNPTREGMIQALSMAQNNARSEIQKAEYKDGDVIPMPWLYFLNEDLYRKLSQYEKVLCDKAVKKIGKEVFEKLIKEKCDYDDFV